jgi:hypothetical protein
MTTSRKKRFALYWCSTRDGDEDWFIVAESARSARRCHEAAEGYGRGEAHAERITTLPDALLDGDGWKNGPNGERVTCPGWPADALLRACGGKITRRTRDRRRVAMEVVCKDVRFGDRVFRAGDIVANEDRRAGLPLRDEEMCVLRVLYAAPGTK